MLFAARPCLFISLGGIALPDSSFRVSCRLIQDCKKPVHDVRKLGYDRFISQLPSASKDMTAMVTRARESSSTNPHGNFDSVSKSLSPDQRFAAEKAFSSVLVNTIREAVGDALGRNVLEILTSKGLLDAASNSKEFDGKLQSLFGNGAAVLERIVVKDLNKKLGIHYNSEVGFDYEKSLETAREVCFVESRLN